jgi:xanthine/uracil/vitamin C permease (AzgA family)
MGYSWEVALGAVFLAGILFVIHEYYSSKKVDVR